MEGKPTGLEIFVLNTLPLARPRRAIVLRLEHIGKGILLWYFQP